MREISIFADESGDKTEKTRYFLLTLVFHDQANGIAESSLYDAVHEVLAKQAVVSRRTTMTEYRQ